MSANNIMDVFLAVKVDQNESDDLAALLDTLQRISALQSAFKASGGVDIDIDVDLGEVKDKIDELQRFLEEDFEVDDKILLSIKNDTDYIISRLWSVSSTEASEEQLKEQFLQVAKDPAFLSEKFLESMVDAERFLKKNFGSVKEGKIKFEEHIRALSSDLVERIESGINDLTTKKGIQVLTRALFGATSVGTQTGEQIITLATKREEAYQESISGVRGGMEKEGGVGRLTQTPLVGQIKSEKYTSSYEKLISGIDDVKTLKLTRGEIDRLIQSVLDKKESVVAPKVLKSIATRLGVNPDDITFETYKLEKGTLMTESFRDEMLKGVSSKTEKIIKGMFQRKKQVDDIITINEKMLLLFDSDRATFEDRLEKALYSFYNEEYADVMFTKMIEALEKTDIKGRKEFSIFVHFKRIGSYAKKLADQLKYYVGLGGKFQEAYIAGGGSPESNYIIMTRKDVLDEVLANEKIEELKKLRTGVPTAIMLSHLMVEMNEIKGKIAKGLATKDDITEIITRITESGVDLKEFMDAEIN